MTKVAPFLIAVVFLFASCGTASPQSEYVSQKAPVIEQLTTWQAHNTDFEMLLTDPNGTPNGMSRLDMLELYNMATDYKITRDDYVKLGFSPLDALVGDASKSAKEGKSIEAILLAATPDEEIKAAHEAVLKCVQTRTAVAEGLSSALKNLGPVDLSGDVSSCSTFEADLAKLTAYVNQHK